MSLRILLVDDMSHINADVARFFGRIGVAVDIQHVMPVDSSLPLVGCVLPSAAEFDEFDVALVDLELSNHERGILYQPSDLAGGTEILPYLRSAAPWLPVIAESRLYEEEAGHFISVAGGFGFDGLWPQSLFRLNKVKLIDQTFWNTTLDRARRLRQEAVVGILPAVDQLPAVEVARGVAASFGEYAGAFESITQTIFHFAGRVALQPLTPGYSGARVFRAFVREHHGNAEANQWLLKVSRFPSKLNAEAQAHMGMMRAGLEFATGVPLLWRGVVTEGRLGAIAYKFAPGTTPAADVVHTDIARVSLQLTSLLQYFYRGAGASSEHAVLQQVLRQFGPSTSTLTTIRSQVAGPTAALFDAIMSDDENELAQVVPFTQTRIHGDLHLGNVMLGDRPVLIDFAHSRIGPIAVDAAKLVVDLLLRRPDFRDASVPKWRDGSAVMRALEPTLDTFMFAEFDTTLFDKLLCLRLSASLTYDDVDSDTRRWILQVLTA